MRTTLTYGQAAEIELELPTAGLLLDRRVPPGEPLGDVAQATAAALRSPLDFPPIQSAVTPDDHVAIALGAGVPQAAAVVAGVIDALCEAGIDPLNIVVVQASEEAGFDYAAQLSEELRTSVRGRIHHAGDREQLSYLAAGDDDQPIYFSRELCDADVVIPIGCLHAAGGLGFTGADAGIYPAFADEAAQRRFHSPGAAKEKLHRQLEHEAQTANWQLGVMLSVQVLPGAGDSVLQVLAGERHAVETAGQALARQAWSFAVPEPASLVVATLAGDGSQQTWENFARALYAASQAVADDGAIALCTQLAERPGAALQRLAGDDDSDAAMRKIRRETSPDALAAAELHRVLADHRVYLLSELDEDLVESLGMAYVASGEEIARLCSRHASCILIANAQFAVPHTM